MVRISHPLNTIVPVAPAGDRRPGLARPAPTTGTIFTGWGPKI